VNIEPEQVFEEVPVPVQPPPRRRAFPRLWQAILLCILFLVLQVGVGGVLALVAFALGRHDQLVAVTAVANLSAFAVVFAVARLWSGLPIKTLFSLRRASPMLLLPVTVSILGLHILLSEADNLLRYFLPLPEGLAEIMGDLLGSSWPGVLVVVLVAPITEEPFFRGILLGGFRQNYRPITAMVLSALLFGLVHMNPWQFVSAFLLGLVFSWWLLRTDSLWPCLYGHALSNGLSMAMVIFPIPIEGYNVLSPDVPFQPLWFDAIGFVLVLIGFAWLTKTFAAQDRKKKATTDSTDDTDSGTVS
jgi:membrane protease YdiL (CAAX protease family)